MLIDRRELIRTSGLVPCLLHPLFRSKEARGAETFTENPTTEELVDQGTLDFWTTGVRQPSELFAKGLVSMAGPGPSEAAFVFYDRERGFQVATTVGDEGLPEKGDVEVLLRVQRFRPSKADTERFNDLKTGTLRIDLQQVQALSGLIEKLAWTAIAGVLPGPDGKLPPLQTMQFDSGPTWERLQRVALPGGAGFWTWNFFLQKKESVWGRIIDLFHEANKVVAPLMGLPAIALTALKAIDNFLGQLQAREKSEWLFKSTDMAVYGTREGKNKVPGLAVPLRKGDYVVVRQSELGQFQPALTDLEINQGLIVKKGTPAFKVFDSAIETLPDLTYLSASVASESKKLTCP